MLAWQHIKEKLDRIAKDKAETILIIRGLAPRHWLLDMRRMDAVIEFHTVQQQIVDQRGRCERGCTRTDLEQLPHNGRTVCRWTRQPCPRFYLKNIVNLYSTINRNFKWQQPN